VKYSVLMPYHDRAKEFRNTLLSFRHHYAGRDDYEVVVVEDLKDVNSHRLHDALLSTLREFMDIPVVVYPSPSGCSNPSPAFNFGAGKCGGEFILLTNPEVMHHADVLSGLDGEFEADPGVYVVCGCRDVAVTSSAGEYPSLQYNDGQWLVHTRHNHRRLHFCTALSAGTYRKVGGFDEEYAKGVGYDDDDFRNQVEAARVRFSDRDDLLTLHQAHARSYAISDALWDVNRQYYVRKWQR